MCEGVRRGRRHRQRTRKEGRRIRVVVPILKDDWVKRRVIGEGDC
jgi:hypothetical protein